MERRREKKTANKRYEGEIKGGGNQARHEEKVEKRKR